MELAFDSLRHFELYSRKGPIRPAECDRLLWSKLSAMVLMLSAEVASRGHLRLQEGTAVPSNELEGTCKLHSYIIEYGKAIDVSLAKDFRK